MADAILGSYSDFKLIKTRSCVQVVIEVPLENAHEITDLLGLPIPGAEIPVAIARLRPGTTRQPQIEHANDEEPPYVRKPLSQVAAILCNIVAFRRFLIEEHKLVSPLDADHAAAFVREHCGVASRKELDTDALAASIFVDMRARYDAWMRAA